MPKAKRAVGVSSVTTATKISLTVKEWIALITSLIVIITTIVVAHLSLSSRIDKLSGQIEVINEKFMNKLNSIDASLNELNGKIDHEISLRKLDYQSRYSENRYYLYRDSTLVYDFRRDTLVYKLVTTPYPK